MEIKVLQGKYVPDEKLGLQRVSGLEEIRQRVQMKLSARRGEFFPLPEFGSRLHTLIGVKQSQIVMEAKKFICEALADEPEISLENVDFVPDDVGGGQLFVSFLYVNDEKFTVKTSI